jgi:hypothetical protein
MSTNILDHSIRAQDGHREVSLGHQVTARELTPDLRAAPGEWFELETTQHDWFGPKPNYSPAGATLRVRIGGGFEATVRQAQAGAACGRRYQWLLYDAGLWDIHVEVQFDTPVGDARRSDYIRPRVRARGRRAPR